MSRHVATLIFLSSSAIGLAALAIGLPAARAANGRTDAQTAQPVQPVTERVGQQKQNSDAPTPAEIKAKAQELAANQHRDDEALKQYERVERHADLTGAPNPHIIEDRTFRVVPTGTGTLKILLKENGTSTTPADYRRQLQAWEDVLELMLRPEDSRAKSAYEKYDKRNQERAELIDTMIESFNPKWVGRETLNGRDCDVFQLDLKPEFHPHSMFQDALTHINAKAWVDKTNGSACARRGPHPAGYLVRRRPSRQGISGRRLFDGTSGGGAGNLGAHALPVRFRRAQVFLLI